jgi:hypothetical protein
MSTTNRDRSFGTVPRLRAGTILGSNPHFFLVLAATKMADETEREYQKQPYLNLNRKSGQKKKVLRRHRNVGLGFNLLAPEFDN